LRSIHHTGKTQGTGVFFPELAEQPGLDDSAADDVLEDDEVRVPHVEGREEVVVDDLLGLPVAEYVDVLAADGARHRPREVRHENRHPSGSR